MLAAGLVAEVRGALDRGIASDAPGLDGIGYREVVAMLQGSLPEPLLRDAILAATRQYAKRQDTWFRNQLRDAPVWMLNATDSAALLAERILDRWQS
jgi:tRNA dimethylallyltransferase